MTGPEYREISRVERSIRDHVDTVEERLHDRIEVLERQLAGLRRPVLPAVKLGVDELLVLTIPEWFEPDDLAEVQQLAQTYMLTGRVVFIDERIAREARPMSSEAPPA